MQPGDPKAGEPTVSTCPASAFGPEISAELLHYAGVQETALVQLLAMADQLVLTSSQFFRMLRGALESTGDSMAPMNASLLRTGDVRQATARVARTSEEACIAALACKQNTETAHAASEQAAENLEEARPILQSLPSQLEALEEGVRNIENMVTVIEDMAQQTNLLSINANIEAARAGESGVGFSRVAERITELAESAGSASRDLGMLIREMARRNRQAFRDIEELERVLSGGISAARAAAQASLELEPAVCSTSASAEQIRAGSGQGATEAETLNEAIDALKARNGAVCSAIMTANSIAVNQSAIYPALQGALETLDILGRRHRAAIIAQSDAPRRQDEYLIDLPRAPLTLDPALAEDPLSRQIAVQIYMGLVQLDSDGNPLPALAVGWSASPDGLTWTFRLRQGARFHNGREINASDVKYSIERVLRRSTSSPFGEYFSAILGAGGLREGQIDEAEGIRIDGDYQITFILESPCPGFLICLGHLCASIVPREEIARFGHLFSRTPVGSGAFAYREGRLEECVTLEAFRAHIEGRPFLDTVKFRVLPSDEERMKNFRHCQTGHLEVRGAGAAAAQKSAGFRELLILANEPEGFCGIFNLRQDGPLMDPRVRQALNLIVDREGLIAGIFAGMAAPAFGPVIPGNSVSGASGTLSGNPADDAKRLMSEACYPAGLPAPLITAVVSGDPRTPAMADALGRMFGQIGVSLTIEERPFETFWDSPKSACDLWLTDLSAGCLDAGEYLRSRFHVGSPLNRGGFFSNQVEESLSLLRSGLSPMRREKEIAHLCGLVTDEAPWLFLTRPTNGVLVQEHVQDFQVDPNHLFPLRRAWMKRRRE